MHKTIETFRNLNRESTKTITIIKVNTIQKINFLKTPNIKKSRTYYIKKTSRLLTQDFNLLQKSTPIQKLFRKHLKTRRIEHTTPQSNRSRKANTQTQRVCQT